MFIKKDYDILNMILLEQYQEFNGYDFYKYLFPKNQKRGEMSNDYSKPNAIYLYRDEKDKDTKRRLRRRIMLDDTFEEDYQKYIKNNPMTLCSGLTYRSRANYINNAQQMNALIIDLDGVGENELKTLFLRFGRPADTLRSLPIPTFIVLSGMGTHIYYIFDEPIDLYPNIKIQLKALKYALTFKMWDYKSTSKQQAIQYQSINQGFRMVGSMNNKYNVPLRAYKIGEKVNIDYMNDYTVDDKNKVDINKPFNPSNITRAEAKEKYPEWYQRVVIDKNKKPKKWNITGQKGHNGDELYNWWINQAEKAKGGHRYYFLMCMSIYACKCDIPKKRLKSDMYKIFEKLKDVEHINPLTESDIESALESYDKEYYNFTIADIEKLTDVRIERNKRNGRNQELHLRGARAIQEINNPNWRDGNGRPSLENIVFDYLKENPKAKKVDVIKATGLSKPTVYKYYDKAKKLIITE